MRILVLFLLFVVAGHAQSAADDYSEQLRQYDQRLAEARQWEAAQQWKSWVPTILILFVLAVYLIYIQVAARRRFNALVERSQKDVERTLIQNQEMIELLKSINDRLGNGK